MTASPNRARDLFVAALKLAPDQWDAFLAAECSDEALRGRVRRLLTANQEAGSFLESPAPGLAPTADEPVPERPGTMIGPYKLLEQIGEGGFGVVFLAEQQEPVRRKVALKVLKPGVDTRQVVARFEAERQALAIMDHPHIAKVFDGGATPAGRPFFVMELVRGVPITDYCDQNHLPPRDRLELFVPVCQAVQHAHQKGVIHRDLKPSNVLVSAHDGKPAVKVIDFGVAKAVGQELTDKTLFTAFAQMVGTPLYMSPEQAAQSPDIDTRSDIYSLGVLLYELLTGSTPFPRERFQRAAYDEIRRIIREEDPPRPSTRLSESKEALPSISALRQTEPARLRKLVRGELDWIVMKALEKDRNRRYETANTFAQDVQRYLADEPVRACPPSAAYRVKKFVRRNRGPVVAAGLVLLALIGGIVGTTWGMFRATDARAKAVDEAGQKKVALEAAQASERDARDQLRLALWSQARASRFGRRPGQRLDSLDALAKAAGIRSGDDLRDEAIAAIALPDVRRVPGWRAAPPGKGAVAYGTHYRLYARVDEPRTISVRTLPDDREVRRIASGEILGSYLYFSPDDRFLLGLEDGYALRVWRVADGRPVLGNDLRDCRAHAFSPDGRLLAVGQDDRVLCFDLETGREVKRWRVRGPAHSLAFHPDGGRVAVGYFSLNAVSVYDVATGDLVADVPSGVFNNHVIAWHPDGDRLAVAGSGPRIYIWSVASRRRLATLDGHVGEFVPTLTFHPEGGLLASHGWDGLLLLWDPATGRPLMRLPAVSPPRFSPDGRWLGVAWHGEGADLLEVTPAPEYRTLAGGAGAPGGVGKGSTGDISPDGRVLAVSMGERAGLWDLRSGRELAGLPAPIGSVFFEPDPAAGPGWRLLTAGADGLLRWPVSHDDPAGTRLRLGPPRQLSPLARAWFARGPDGRTRGAATEESGANRILDLETGTVLRDLPLHWNGEVRAVSPDGRWAASSGWASDRVRLWDAGTGRLVHEWALGKRVYVFFTPDSRTLVIAQDHEFGFWDVETLRPVRRLARDISQFPGHVAFSPDGKLMALEMAPAVLHLTEVATGRTVARLEDPHGGRAGWQAFTPDGTRLVVASADIGSIHVWDLRAVRGRLAGMGLDWDWPAFGPADPTDEPGQPFAGPGLKVRVVESDTQRARRLYDQAIGLAAQRKLIEAAAAYLEVVRLDPDHCAAHYALADVLDRLGRLDMAAADYLARSRQRNPEYDQDSVILFVLSMAYADRKEAEPAQAFFDRAALWRMGIGFTDEELRRVAAAAAARLGVEIPAALKEPPVLAPGPTLLAPAAGATLDNGTADGSRLMAWAFDWSDVPGATRYHLHVMGPTGKRGPLISDPSPASSSYRYEIAGSVADDNRTGWRWKVRALVNGTWTDWSAERAFALAPVSRPGPARK